MKNRNLRLLIAFDGSNYSGWQSQHNAPTIQGTLEKCLKVMLNSSVTLHGSGRTDAGVHALGLVAHFHTSSNIPSDGFLKGLNSMLPRDIRILDVNDVDPQFHSRYSAIGKCYRYDICTSLIQMPTERLYRAHFPGPVDIRRINDCLDKVIGTHDFSSFEASGSRDISKTNSRGAVRTMFDASFAAQPETQDMFSFTFTGDGFLRHMVRNLVGTLMEVGKGKYSPDEFNAILKNCDRTTAGPTAPPNGLFLIKVFYDPAEL